MQDNQNKKNTTHLSPPEIVDAAYEVAKKTGYQKFVMQDVANKLNCEEKTLRQCFTMEELRKAVLKIAVERGALSFAIDAIATRDI